MPKFLVSSDFLDLKLITDEQKKDEERTGSSKGLDFYLQRCTGRRAFESFVVNRGNKRTQDLLNFWIEVEDLKEHVDSPTYAVKRAKIIYKRYLAKGKQYTFIYI